MSRAINICIHGDPNSQYELMFKKKVHGFKDSRWKNGYLPLKKIKKTFQKGKTEQQKETTTW